MSQSEFEAKWHHKIVRPRGLHWQIPIKDYRVTACLYEYEEGKVTIFAIMALDYTPENKHWFTFHLSPSDMEWLDKDIEIKA